MNNNNQLRNTGILCIIGAIIWIVAITIEYPFHLQPPTSGLLAALDQSLFILAHIGFIAGILGLFWSKAAGDGWFSKLSLGLFGIGWSLIAIGTLYALITNNYETFFLPIGGIMASLGCLLSGIAIARNWSGWQRWSVLIYALYYWAALFLPLVIANQEPNQITETIWGLAWLLIGFALYSNGRNSEMVTA